MDAEGHARVIANNRVVELHRSIQHPIRIAPALPIALADLFIEKCRVLRGVDLDVLAAKAGELGNLASGEIHDVGKIRVACGIRAP